MRAMRLPAVAGLVFSAAATNASANALGDAWACAKNTAQAGYELAGKGAKAAEVLGTAPVCVGQAVSGDPPLIILSGGMIVMNAVDPVLLPAQGCLPAVKNQAIKPLAKILADIVPGVPSSLLAEGSTQAGNALWDALQATPLQPVLQRTECGCTFLEAGITVQTLKDMFKTIAAAGKACDALAENIPGYKESKTAVNNFLEDTFTDQVTAKPADQYYYQDIRGGSNEAFSVISHAAAKAIDPGHNWMTTGGKKALYQTNWTEGGFAPGSVIKDGCVSYFDGHKMSKSNADKTCTALMQQFDADYQTYVPMLKARDAFVKGVGGELAKVRAAGLAQCKQSVTGENEKLSCANGVNSAVGHFDWQNPYDSKSSLGAPVDPATVDSQLKGTGKYYFSPPLGASGAHGAGYTALESSGYNVQAAIKQAVGIAQTGVAAAVQKAKDDHARHQKEAAEVATQRYMNEVGKLWNDKCPSGTWHTFCTGRLRQAWDICQIQLDKVPKDPKSSGDVFVPDPAKYKQTLIQCANSYLDLTIAWNAYSGQMNKIQKMESACPGSAGSGAVGKQCVNDLATVKKQCTGGLPHITDSFFVNPKVAQDPAPGDCSAATAYFKQKWEADDLWLGQLNGAYSSAATACVSLGITGSCQAEVSKKVDQCKAQVTKHATEVIGPLALDSNELTNALSKLDAIGGNCKEAVLKVPEKFAKGKEDQILVLQLYGKQCPPRGKGGDYAGMCAKELLGALATCEGHTTPVAAGSATSSSSTGGKLAGASATSGAGMPNMEGVNVGATATSGAAAAQALKSPEQIVAGCAKSLQAVVDKYNALYAKENNSGGDRVLAMATAGRVHVAAAGRGAGALGIGAADDRAPRPTEASREGQGKPLVDTPRAKPLGTAAGDQRTSASEGSRAVDAANARPSALAGAPTAPGTAREEGRGSPSNTPPAGLATTPPSRSATEPAGARSGAAAVPSTAERIAVASPATPAPPGASAASPDAQLKAAGCAGSSVRGQEGQYTCPAGTAMTLCQGFINRAGSTVKACAVRAR